MRPIRRNFVGRYKKWTLVFEDGFRAKFWIFYISSIKSTLTLISGLSSAGHEFWSSAAAAAAAAASTTSAMSQNGGNGGGTNGSNPTPRQR